MRPMPRWSVSAMNCCGHMANSMDVPSRIAGSAHHSVPRRGSPGMNRRSSSRNTISRKGYVASPNV